MRLSGQSQIVKSMTFIFIFYYGFTTWQQLQQQQQQKISRCVERTSAVGCPSLYSVPVYIQFCQFDLHRSVITVITAC